jgi:hypothetical protein
MTLLHVQYMREKMVYLTNPDGNVFEKKSIHMVNQAKPKSFNTAPQYKYSYEIPRTYEQAKRLDLKNGNSLWGEATALELGQIDEYATFIDKGHHTKASPPNGFKKIRDHLVFDVKHDGRLRPDWFLMDTSPIFHLTHYIQEL